MDSRIANIKDLVVRNDQKVMLPPSTTPSSLGLLGSPSEGFEGLVSSVAALSDGEPSAGGVSVEPSSSVAAAVGSIHWNCTSALSCASQKRLAG